MVAMGAGWLSVCIRSVPRPQARFSVQGGACTLGVNPPVARRPSLARRVDPAAVPLTPRGGRGY